METNLTGTDALMQLVQQLLPVVVAYALAATVKWWNKQKGTRWHVLLSPIVAIMGGAVASMALGVEVDAETLKELAAPGGAAVVLQSVQRGGRDLARGKLGNGS